MACRNEEDDTVTTYTEEHYQRDFAYQAFTGDKEMARAIAEGTVLAELPYRGETTQVLSTRLGVVGRVSVLGILREPWHGEQASRWTPFGSVEAARAWQQGLVAELLRGEVYRYNGRHFTSWAGTGWAVEIDHFRQRYTAVVGLAPGVTAECFTARLHPEESMWPAEERGWAWLAKVLPVGPEQWPYDMAGAYARVQADAERRADEAERKAGLAELADERDRAADVAALAQASAEEELPSAEEELATAGASTGWWGRLVGWLASLLRIGGAR